MGNCLVKNSKRLTINFNYPRIYKSNNERDRAIQENLIKFVHNVKKEKKLLSENLKLVQNDDLKLKNLSRNLHTIKKSKRLQSEKLKQFSANLKNEIKNKRRKTIEINIWDQIQLKDIDKGNKEDVRSADLKHILRTRFDFIHWEVILRIFQVNSNNDIIIHEDLFREHMNQLYQDKFNILFKKKQFKGNIIHKKK